MFDALSDRLDRIATRLRGRGRLTDADLDEALGEIRSALLDADVELGVVRAFVAAIKQRCAGEALSKSLTPGQQVIKEVHEELVRILGGENLKITYASRPPTVVLLAGLQGSGKTTTAAKLALWWKQQGRNPLLVAADLQRPAAVEQLRILGDQAGVRVFSEPTDPVSVAAAGLEEARRIGRDVCIIDTAGRLAIDDDLMEEVRKISEVTTPHYTFLVIDAMTGQDAVATATAFHQTLALDGVILTKLDGDARGGAALSVKEVVGRPIAFASTGEKLADFDLFHPDRMADRILGMGDVLSLIEQAERAMDRDSVTKSATRMIEGKFSLEDFLEQLQQVKKLGSLGGVLKLLPGLSKEVRQAAGQIDDGEISRVEAIIRSMTPLERDDTTIIDGSRRNRIANGSGTTTSEVNALLKQFKEVQKMMKGIGAGGKTPGLGGLGGLGGGLGKLGSLVGAGRSGLGGLSGATAGSLGPGAVPGARATLGPEIDDLSAIFNDPGRRLGDAATPGSATQRRSTSTTNARRGGKKKKKGGRVTPPKPR
ncbi:MAG: signal recognition particle protein [Acidimicrobiales bacterium]|jgi:signal recognition particle subunit SRP54